LVEKEEALSKLQEFVQENQEANPLSIALSKVNTMTETNLVQSPSIDISQEYLGYFEKYIRELV
jgi:hypothetical protein